MKIFHFDPPFLLNLHFQSPMARKENQTIIITDKYQMRTWARTMRSLSNTIALVPTMGFLHDGHLSLIQEAHNHSQLVVVSIYVNPSQFAPSEDLSTYPSDFDGDIRKLMDVPGGVDVVFHPHNLYDYGVESAMDCAGMPDVSCLEESGSGHETWVRVERLEKGMCGRSRPVFFRGVATVVAKLFNIVDPDVAVFGKKDYQQWRIIRRMVSLCKNVNDFDFHICFELKIYCFSSEFLNLIA